MCKIFVGFVTEPPTQEPWMMDQCRNEFGFRPCLYHGSSVPDLTELMPFSVLHGSDEKVVYLSSSVPYTLLYIWDAEKTQYSHKWVTGWVKDGIAYYEEQFPGQLKAFYEGVRGYVYSVLKSGDVQTLPQRENLFYSRNPICVYRVTEIPDVYQALLEYERAGKFRVSRYENASEEKQTELTEQIATYIIQNNLLEQDSEESGFMKRYFAQAWEKGMTMIGKNDKVTIHGPCRERACPFLCTDTESVR